MSDKINSNPFIAGPLNMPKLPVGGYFIRLGAIVIDLIFLLATLHFLRQIAPGLFWAAGEWSSYLSGGICFFYFALGNGPLGKGRTIGKLFLGLQTTGYDDQPPLLRQSALRTLVLIPVFWMAPLLDALLGRSGSLTLRWLETQAPGYAVLAMFFAAMLGIAFNPFKQGLHDFFAQTLVRKRRDINEPAPPFQELTDEVGEGWLKFHRQPIYSGGIAFLGIFIALIVLSWPRQQGPYFGLYNQLFEMKVKPWFGQDYVSIPAWESQVAPMFDFLELDEGFLAEIDDSTTGTVSLFVRIERRGNWNGDPSEDTALLPRIEESMAIYHEKVLPEWGPLMRESGRIEFEEMAKEMEQAEKVKLYYIFMSIAHMDPYPNPLRRVSGIYGKDFPPIEIKEEAVSD